MKEDRLITAVGVTAAVMAILMMSVGKFIMGGIVLLLSFAIFLNRGGGRFNDRSIYEKVVKTDLGIDELYERLKDTDTPLGRAWIGEHKGFSGDSIVFGPSRYKDVVVISRHKDKLDIKHITKLENIIRSSDDEYRFNDLISASEVEVTPERYSKFAGLKLASVMLVQHIYELVCALDKDRSAEMPDALDFFKFYYHNSTEGYFRDSEGNDVLKVEAGYTPFVSRVLDADGEEMASVMPRAFNGKGVVMDSGGYELTANGEHYGDIRKYREGGKEGFIVSTDDGEFRVNVFTSCLRANISNNHTVEKDGRLMAVIGGSPNILFDTCGRCRNDVILSYDDDYLVLYAVLETFILTLNGKYLR